MRHIVDLFIFIILFWFILMEKDDQREKNEIIHSFIHSFQFYFIIYKFAQNYKGECVEYTKECCCKFTQIQLVNC